MKKILSIMTVVLVLGGFFAIQTSPVVAIEPGMYLVEGNPSCADLAANPTFDNITSPFGFKVNAQPVGDDLAFTLITGIQNDYETELTGGAPSDSSNSITINSDGVIFDWIATIGIDAVIVKAQDANVFVYVPEAYNGDDLYAPLYRDISHIEFCYDYELDISKTAETSLTRTYQWEITKEADGTYDLFTGDKQDHLYTVSVKKTGSTDSDWAVSGDITVTNKTPFDATILDVIDIVADNGEAIPDCGVDFPYTLPSGGQLVCTYTKMLNDGSAGTNKAVVKTSGVVGGAHIAVPFEFTDPVITKKDTSVTVDDTNGQKWEASDDASWTYTKTFTCDADEGKNENTATFVTSDTGATGSDSATVMINCYALEVKKTAETSFTRTYQWKIQKDFDATYNLFAGEGVEHDYKVTVTPNGYLDSGWKVSGTIEITNPAPMAAMLTSVSDIVSPDIVAKVDCPTLLIPAGEKRTCTYSADLPDATSRTNTATATLQNYHHKLTGPEAIGTTDFSGTTAVEFGTAKITEVNKEITVSDTNGEAWGPVSAGTSWEYRKEFVCSKNPADYQDGYYSFSHKNTATIDQTGQSDDAMVEVNCYAPVVKKTAETSLERTWIWKIGKVGKDPLLGGQLQTLTLSVGQVYEVLYGVTVSAVSADSGWGIHGTITVANPADKPMTVKLSDSLDDGTLVTIDYCETPAAEFVLIDGMLTVPAGMTATCYYSASPEDDSATLNTATATLNEIDFTATAQVDFSQATISETDECIDVSDDQYGDLGTVCASDTPKTFTYKMLVGPYDVCGQYEFVNVASFDTNDTGATGSDSWTIVVDVPCGGCTLTIGYWKTHSKYGPAPYDATWAKIGEDTPFFLSGKTYYQVMWTPPAGNAYYILAPQYVAAMLNMLNGASVPSEVQAAFDEATALFETYTPAEIAKLKGKAGTELRAKFIALANILDKYNNGEMGVPYCSE
jgi:hypothetical protein